MVPGRFNGPASSANGGWAAGALAQRAAQLGVLEPVTVQLRRPPPLERSLEVVATGDTVELRDGDELVAVAGHDAELAWSPPAAVPLEDARRAERSYPGHRSHPFPTCFSCGPARSDGLRIFPGRIDERVAATWTPDEPLTEDGSVDLPVTWAALDCVGGWSSDLEDRPLVLARMTAVQSSVQSPPQAGTPYVVVGTTVRVEGRKTWTASALFDASGALVAQAQHLWIAIEPSVVRQLQGG